MRRLSLLLFFVFVPHVHGDQIPLGLRFEQIFVQEYWYEGKPHYAIVNLDKAPARVSNGTETWRVKAGAVIQAEVAPGKPGKGLNLVTFTSDARRLGLLESPIVAPEPAKKRYLVNYGLNGSGGRFQLVYAQQKWTFPSEGTIELDLIIPAHRGTVTFWKEKRNDYPLAQVFVAEAKCDTLTITDDGKSLIINAGKPLTNEKFHTVQLTLKAPRVASRTMFMLDGWMALTDGGGHGVTRAIVVAPAN